MGRYITTTVDVDLCDFDTDDLLEELESRGLEMNTRYVDADEVREQLEAVWQQRRKGLPFELELDQLIYTALGRIV